MPIPWCMCETARGSTQTAHREPHLQGLQIVAVLRGTAPGRDAERQRASDVGMQEMCAGGRAGAPPCAPIAQSHLPADYLPYPVWVGMRILESFGDRIVKGLPGQKRIRSSYVKNAAATVAGL